MDLFKTLANDNNRQPQTSSQEREGDNLLERFANKLNLADVERADQQPPPPPPEPKSIFDKLGDVVDDFSGKKHSPPPPPKPEGLFDKISDVLGGGKQEDPRKPQTMGDKIGDTLNSALGGGSRGEAKEDHLDKAIDFVQQHVLKEGQQNNESALEQAKDGQIADAIRHGLKSFTGKDIPSSKNDSK